MTQGSRWPGEITTRSSDGQHHAILTPAATVPWGPIKADQLVTFYHLAIDDEPLPGLYGDGLVWATEGVRLAVARWNLDQLPAGPLQVPPDQRLVLIDPAGRRQGVAAAGAATRYRPKALSGSAVIYDKQVRGSSAIREMEVDPAAVRHWDPI
jgi:hypothetical protein